jgi:hypothetical protein
MSSTETKKRKSHRTIPVYACQGVPTKSSVTIRNIGEIKKREYQPTSLVGGCDSHIKDVKGYVYACNLTEEDLHSSTINLISVNFWRHVNGMDCNLLEVTSIFEPDIVEIKKEDIGKEISGKFKLKLSTLNDLGTKESTIIDGAETYPATNKDFLLSIPKNDAIKAKLEQEIMNFNEELTKMAN